MFFIAPITSWAPVNDPVKNKADQETILSPNASNPPRYLRDAQTTVATTNKRNLLLRRFLDCLNRCHLSHYPISLYFVQKHLIEILSPDNPR